MVQPQVRVVQALRNTVLVVDDQSTGRAILEQVARGIDPNVQVESFDSPIDAIHWAAGRLADLVLVDYQMPQMDGIEFVRRLRLLPDYAHVPVVMVTVNESRNVRYSALDAGVTDFLTKPIDARECLARCRNLMTLRRQQLVLEERRRLLEDMVQEATKDVHARAQQLEYESRRFRAIMETAIDGLHIINSEGRLVEANPAFLRMLGYTRDEALGLHISDWDVGFGRVELKAMLARANTLSLNEALETRHRRKDGSIFDVEVSISGIEIDGQVYSYAAARDITRRRAAVRRIERLIQLYALLSNINQAIVRTTSEEELYERISRAAFGHGGVHGAVFRIADEEKVLRVVACSENMRSVTNATVNTVDPALPEAITFVAIAYREDRVIVNNDLTASEPGEPWRTAVRAAGIRSNAALPIRRLGKPIGVLVLNATEPDFFDAEMSALLGDIVIDIAFALDSFEGARQRTYTERALAESEVKFRCLVEQSLTGISVVEGDRFTYVNPRFAEIHGYAPEEMTGLHIIDTVAEEDRPPVQENIRKRLSGEETKFSYSFNARRKDGSAVRVGVHVAPATMEGRPITISMIQDISERENAQRRIDAYVRQLEDAILGTVTAVSTMVEVRDPYTAGHERRVGALAKAIAAEMDLPEDTCRGLEHIGTMHDLGKISIPAEILSKPSRLTELEFSMVKNHAQAGHDILKDVVFPWPVAKAILQHHERIDGSGYPNALKGDDIIMEARILAVADVVESMASHRPYRASLGIDAAIDEIEKCRGLRYDAKVVDACLNLFRKKDYRLPT